MLFLYSWVLLLYELPCLLSRIFLISKNPEIEMLTDKIRIGFIVEGVKVDKVLKFNKKIFAAVCFCFITDFFFLFYSHYFFNTFFVD